MAAAPFIRHFNMLWPAAHRKFAAKQTRMVQTAELMPAIRPQAGRVPMHLLIPKSVPRARMNLRKIEKWETVTCHVTAKLGAYFNESGSMGKFTRRSNMPFGSRATENCVN
jgi:hypothetical protein